MNLDIRFYSLQSNKSYLMMISLRPQYYLPPYMNLIKEILERI